MDGSHLVASFLTDKIQNILAPKNQYRDGSIAVGRGTYNKHMSREIVLVVTSAGSISAQGIINHQILRMSKKIIL